MSYHTSIPAPTNWSPWMYDPVQEESGSSRASDTSVVKREAREEEGYKPKVGAAYQPWRDGEGKIVRLYGERSEKSKKFTDRRG